MPFRGSRHEDLEGDRLELLAPLGVAVPIAAHLKDFAGAHGKKRPHDSHEPGPPLNLHLGDGVAILLVIISNPLDLPLDIQMSPSLSLISLKHTYIVAQMAR